MSFDNRNSGTYVGDFFNLSFLKGDDNTLVAFEGYRCKLLGFKREIKPFLNHHLNALVRYPGFYEVIGDPIVKLEDSRVAQIPLINLVPEGYKFTDRLLKNSLYIAETRKHKFLGELPHIAYNIGDKVLVSAHGKIREDFVSEILDIVLKGTGVFYTLSPDDEIQEIRFDRIIDVIEYGELTELERLGKLHRCYESLSKHRISRFKYTDDENTQYPED